MEQGYKVKYLTVVVCGFLAIFAMLNWYGTIGREDVRKVSKKEYLDYDEAKVAAANHNPSRQYYYQIDYTERTRKSIIPFVYNTEPITAINKQLMSKPH